MNRLETGGGGQIVDSTCVPGVYVLGPGDLIVSELNPQAPDVKFFYDDNYMNINYYFSSWKLSHYIYIY